MSFKLFLQGKSPQEIKRIKSQPDYQENLAEDERRAKKLEHGLKLVRAGKEWHDLLSELERAVWERITGQKQLPKPIW
jgi:hypothetical protein